MSAPAIRVANLSKDFEVYDSPREIALELLTRKKRHRIFKALDNVSFDVEKGEVLGIIGSNGAGKSTLLKIITGVLDPSAGIVEITGKVTAILELGLGFNMEYTGRENIKLSGLLYGMTQAEIDRKLDSIIDFSGLGDFIEMPIKTYSSGMFARLAFSIATAADPEILIIDEALAAGDAMFVQKCLRRIREFCNSGRTVLLVSHGTGLLAQLCKRVVWLDKGQLKACGPALSVIQKYDMAAHAGVDSKSWLEEVPSATFPTAPLEPEAAETPATVEKSANPEDAAAAAEPAADESGPAPPPKGETKKILKRGPYFIDQVELLDANGAPTTTITTTLPFTLRVKYRCDGPIPPGTLGIAIAVNRQHDLAPVSQWFTQNIMPNETRESYNDTSLRIRPSPKGTVTMEFSYTPYSAGTYILSVGLLANEPANWEFYEYRHLFYTFSVDDSGLGVGAPVYFRPFLTHTPEPGSGNSTSPVPAPSSAHVPAKLLPEDITTLRQEIISICVDEGGYPHDWPSHKSCPCCGRGPLKPAFFKFGFEHKQCQACQFVCVDPYPPDKVAEALYKGQYYTKVRELFELPRARQGEESTPFSAPRALLLDLIERHTRKKAHGRWLDAGGGIGAFANLVKQWVPGWEVTLNEFNPRSLEIAEELYGIKTSAKSAQDLFDHSEKFDVISSVMVLEHISDPLSFVKGYGRLLNPGGTLITIVPNLTYLTSVISRASSASLAPPFHLSLFNSNNLSLLLERAGLFGDILLEESGPAAFSLIHHISFGDRWDISIPTENEPVPKGILVDPYDTPTALCLNALSEADQKLGEYFADADGRLWLVATATVKA